ncbi:MAG: hypothetical protein AVDCRST_MAG29-51 [uncultured Nocardioidaceae bacterium]|uniref:Uncharacterized protein n=1 Tax=uncultured Nocardioidaceae bacterium TaxID=253824 RepID=A0A6J4KUU9_9ACTN|nr:MAG: hypothetical protein AVDCRST_MAG29-51 [uncultured Nocardioidaceae bacterium]
MIWAFFSRRLRTWALFAVLLPLVGRILELLGRRVTPRNPQVGGALTKAGGYARRPTTGRGRRRRF